LNQSQKRLSIDISLLPSVFLVRLLNHIFYLHSNFTITTKTQNLIINDDFDLDVCIMILTKIIVV
ncbi:unnamed protein product, partial [Rotaria magnacalcarata]